MVTDAHFKNLFRPASLHNYDVFAAIRFSVVGFGDRVGLSAALIRSLFHVIRRSPV